MNLGESQAASAVEKLGYAGLWMFIFSLPWGSDTTVVGGVVLASWIFMIPVGVALLRLAMVKGFRPLCPIHFLLLAFSTWATASLMWTLDHDSTITRVQTYVQLLLFVTMIWEFSRTKARVTGLITSYVLGSGMASATTIYNYATGRTTSVQAGMQWETYRYSVDGINADELGLIVALSLPMALYLLNASKNPWLKAICWLQVIAGFIGISLTATRGALFAAVIGVVTISGPTLFRMSRTQKLAAAAVCVALVLSAAYVVPKTSIDRYLSTGTELTEGTLTHRTVIWAAGISVFRDHPIIGVGAGAYAQAIVRITALAIIAHNTFLSILVELGVVGAVLMLLLLSCILYCILRMPRLERAFWLALSACWLAGANSVTWEHRKITWLLFGLVAAQAYAKNAGVFRSRHEYPPDFVYQMRGFAPHHHAPALDEVPTADKTTVST